MSIALEYYVSYGRLGGSETISYEYEGTAKEEAAFLRARILELDFEDVPELSKVLDKACREIKKLEMDEYGTDTDEEGLLCVHFTDTPDWLDDPEEEELEEALLAAVKAGDAKYIKAIHDKYYVSDENDEADDSKFWKVLVEKIKQYKHPRSYKKNADDK